ncbi:hypothetical protein PsorP6_004578 [Peronosclerospora sorghi]|uniref:Uncharacterized protein n=1 Tax=Peronosclerospora sorghi TaxID=230839 RepID=A0ACC0VK97_9STRA|nr:hypothetical protein PsorP6_004578 [Peronosclerospora sorghi]
MNTAVSPSSTLHGLDLRTTRPFTKTATCIGTQNATFIKLSLPSHAAFRSTQLAIYAFTAAGVPFCRLAGFPLFHFEGDLLLFCYPDSVGICSGSISKMLS